MHVTVLNDPAWVLRTLRMTDARSGQQGARCSKVRVKEGKQGDEGRKGKGHPAGGGVKHVQPVPATVNDSKWAANTKREQDTAPHSVLLSVRACAGGREGESQIGGM